MSLLLTYLSRKALIAENLQSMGVNSANSNNGLTTLAGKILNIEPSISGLNIETSINLRSSTNTSFVGQSITFEAEVIVTYDDETATNVDLSGVLTGATIIFKNGDNILGTGITDANGIATYTCAFNTMGNHFITATFEGTDNFVSCVSSSINISTNYDIIISSNKSILSYAHNDTATINCLLSDGLSGKSGETLSYEILNSDDKLIDSGSDITNSSGEVNFTYNSCGIGDITIVVYYGNSFQKTFVVEDCNLYDVGSQSGLSHYGTPIPLQSNTNACQITYDSTMNAYKVTDQSSSIKGIPFNLNNLPSNIKIECDLYCDNHTSSRDSVIGIFGGTASNGFDYLITSNLSWLFTKNLFTGSTQSILLSSTNKTGQWVHLTVTNNNGSVTATFSQNDTTIVTDTISTSNISQYGIATGWGNGYYAYIKNIKVKALPSYDLSISASDDIVSSGDTTTLTATLTDNSVPLTGETLSYQIKHSNTVISTGSDTTDSNGQILISYVATGVGDVTIEVGYDNLLQEIYAIEDCHRYDDATSDKTSQYTPIISYRGSTTGTWNYNSNNGYYGTINPNNAESMITIPDITGLDDFTIEFDVMFTTHINSLLGICAYEDNNTYSRLTGAMTKSSLRQSINGSASEFDVNHTNSFSLNTWVHYKYTITNGNIVLEITKGSTNVCSRTISYTPTNSTKYGFALVWHNDWVKNSYIKNIKVKAL